MKTNILKTSSSKTSSPKTLTRVVSALIVTSTLFSASTAFATTPFAVANQAYRGELRGIPGYQLLIRNLRIGRISGADILAAAGMDGDTQEAQLVEDLIRSNFHHR